MVKMKSISDDDFKVRGFKKMTCPSCGQEHIKAMFSWTDFKDRKCRDCITKENLEGARKLGLYENNTDKNKWSAKKIREKYDDKISTL